MPAARLQVSQAAQRRQGSAMREPCHCWVRCTTRQSRCWAGRSMQRSRRCGLWTGRLVRCPSKVPLWPLDRNTRQLPRQQRQLGPAAPNQRQSLAARRLCPQGSSGGACCALLRRTGLRGPGRCAGLERAPGTLHGLASTASTAIRHASAIALSTHSLYHPCAGVGP